MSSPGIVIVSKYTTSKSKKFSSYVNYVNREQAVRSKNFTKFNLNTLDRFKSKVANTMLNRDQELKQITSLIREQMGQKNQEFKQLPDYQLRNLYQKIYQSLPQDKRMWKYNMNALDNVKPYINQFINVYLNTYEKDNLKEFDQLLEKEVIFRNDVYGQGKLKVIVRMIIRKISMMNYMRD